jgi:hypothetical protein
MENKGIVIACWTAVAAAGGYLVFGPAPHEGNSEAEIKKTVKTYVSAFAQGDGEKACAQLTDTARQAVAGVSGNVGAKSCPQAFERTREIGGKSVIEAARRIQVRKVRLDGGTATVELRAGTQDSVAQLEQVGSGWKISTLPKS